MTSNRPPDTVETAAQYLLDHFSVHVVALMAYGSRVCGHARKGSAFDFWLIVDNIEKFHHDNREFYRSEINVPSTPEKQIALNRSGPNFYALKPDGVEIKKNSQTVKTFEPKELNLEAMWQDPNFNASESCYYYVRLLQANNEEAISSPIWVN